MTTICQRDNGWLDETSPPSSCDGDREVEEECETNFRCARRSEFFTTHEIRNSESQFENVTTYEKDPGGSIFAMPCVASKTVL